MCVKKFHTNCVLSSHIAHYLKKARGACGPGRCQYLGAGVSPSQESGDGGKSG